MNAIIIEDDFLNIDLIKNLCQKYAPEVNILGAADNVNEGIEMLVNLKPDLLFLDVEIHNQTAFDILNSINLNQLIIVMVTAHEKYALQALKANVADFLLKPVSILEFTKSMEKCLSIFQEQHKDIDSKSHTSQEVKHISIPYKEHIEIIQVDDILHLEAKGSYTIITTISNIQHTSSKPLKEYEARLPLNLFLRVHNSHIINVEGVSKYLRSRTGSLLLKNNTEVPISASRKNEVHERLIQ